MENLKVLINKYHYQKRPTLSCTFFWLAAFIPSLFYFAAISAKNLLYTLNILKEKKVKPYVICVGNLTTGGAGKTPIVCEIANYSANELNKKTAVISRGYGSKFDNSKVNVIKDKNGTYFDDGTICADEPLLIAKNTKNCVVLVCKDRVKAAEYAHKNYGCEVVVLDDGFSNRKIKKDFSVLVVDSKKMFGNGFVLPLGPLREPPGRITQADYIIVSNKNDKNAQEALNKISKKACTEKISSCSFVCGSFYNMKNSLEIIPAGEKASAFCAIGQPQQFYDYLRESFDIVFEKTFADHHAYNQNDINLITKKSLDNGAKYAVTTQKDEVKIKKLIKSENEINFITLKLKAHFSDKGLFWAIEKGIKNAAQ